MKKKVWIRVLGWIGLCGWLAAAAGAFVVATSHDSATRQQAGAFIGLALFFGIPACFVWFVGSIIDGFMRRQATLQGQALAQALAGGRETAAATGHAQGVPLQFAPVVPACVSCGAPGAPWWCYQHAVALCHNCAGHHHAANGSCQWATAQAQAAISGGRPKIVKTSPIGGLR